jgi:hypothetical protein
VHPARSFTNRCDPCGRVIPKGALYEIESIGSHARGKGVWTRVKRCSDCAELQGRTLASPAGGRSS